MSWMDMKLGLRMLVRNPCLTTVGALAMAFAIAVGAAAFEFVDQVVSPSLPLPEGHRIVGIRLWHTSAHGVEEQALWDYTTWRGQLRTVDDLGVFRTVERNLIGGDLPGDPIMTAEISASAFALTRVPPLIGRTIVEADEQPAAPPVVVIGHDVWQSRFGGNPEVVGRTVLIGATQRAVIGVMPAGFGFPRSHSLWVPLRLSEVQFDRRQGPWVQVFGRLAPGVSFAEAQTELTTFGLRAAADFPDTHAQIRPEVLPYAQTVSPDPERAEPDDTPLDQHLLRHAAGARLCERRAADVCPRHVPPARADGADGAWGKPESHRLAVVRRGALPRRRRADRRTLGGASRAALVAGRLPRGRPRTAALLVQTAWP